MTCSTQLQTAREALTRYLLHVLEDGDYLNDWLTHLPDCSQLAVYHLGYWLSLLLGGY